MVPYILLAPCEVTKKYITLWMGSTLLQDPNCNTKKEFASQLPLLLSTAFLELEADFLY